MQSEIKEKCYEDFHIFHAVDKTVELKWIALMWAFPGLTTCWRLFSGGNIYTIICTKKKKLINVWENAN